MSIYLFRRFLAFLVAFFLTSILIFVLVRVIGGNPATTLLGEYSTPEAVREIEIQLGLDRPIVIQYFEWIVNLCSGDLGTSFRSGLEVNYLLASAIPVSISLSIGALIVAVLIGFPLGIISAVKSYRGSGTALDFFSQIGVAMPICWSGALLSMFFGVRLGLLPTGGWVGWSENYAQSLRHLVLPSIALGLGIGSVITRFVRTAVVEVMRQDYVRTGRAFGMSEYRALFSIGLRNASLPIVTVFGNIVSHLVGGTVITETLFSMPGLSRMILDNVISRDILVVQNLVMIIVVYILIVNFIVDISYFSLDKRLRVK